MLEWEMSSVGDERVYGADMTVAAKVAKRNDVRRYMLWIYLTPNFASGRGVWTWT